PKNYLGCQLVSDALEPCAQRAVDDQIPGAQYRAADERRVRDTLQPHGASQPPLQGRSQRASLGIVERRGGGDGHVDDTLSLTLELIEARRDLRQQCQSPIVRKGADEVATLLVELWTRDPGDERGQLLRRDVRVAEQRLNPRVGNHGGSGLERFRPGAEPLVVARLFEGRLRVGSGNRALICHPSSLRQICAASLLMRSWCAFGSISRSSSLEAAAMAISPISRLRPSRARVVSSPICCCAEATRR